MAMIGFCSPVLAASAALCQIQNNPGMWRSVKAGGQLSDMSNLSWAKNAVLIAAEREPEWEDRQRRAIDPSKCPEKRGSLPATAPLIHFSSAALSSIPSSTNANPESLTALSSPVRWIGARAPGRA